MCVLTRATISFPEHARSRVRSRNGVRHANETCANLNYAVKRFVCILNCYIFKYDVLSECLTLFWFAVLQSEYVWKEFEFGQCLQCLQSL